MIRTLLSLAYLGSIPGQETKILQVMWCSQKKKKKKRLKTKQQKINIVEVTLPILFHVWPPEEPVGLNCKFIQHCFGF